MKAKTRSWVKKRVKVTWTKKLQVEKSCKRHLLSDKSKKAKWRNKYGKDIKKSELKRVKEMLPNL